MPQPINSLKGGRDLSLDAFRGITFLVMIFVNLASNVKGLPYGINHMPADHDGMSLADIVFPCFLFIVGMSVPFSINSRIMKGDSILKLQWHVAYRAFGLIVMGFFMVNTEEGYNEKAMGMSIDLWAMMFYAAALLVWGVYRFKTPLVNYALRSAGVTIVIALAAIYRSGPDGSGWMTPAWWGILGCIGWAYLLACFAYQLARGSALALAALILVCALYFSLGHAFDFNEVVSMHITHTSLVLCGVVCALIFFDNANESTHAPRFKAAAVFAVALTIVAAVFHRYFIISKIGATPPWALYCGAIATIVFMLLYWLINIRAAQKWVAIVEPAASNPLVTYLIPHVVDCIIRYFSLAWPAFLLTGKVGIVFAITYAFAVIGAVSVLNKYNFKLKI
ncbi:MAG TPA: DUF5009 domain-containing protein [Burkholderiaceae bacterium]